MDGFDPLNFRQVDPVSPDVPQQRGIGGQGFPNVSGIDVNPEMGQAPEYPQPVMPPLPSGRLGADIANIALTGQAILRALMSSPWSREVLAAFAEEASRVFYRPVHLPPWHEMPIRGTPMQGSSAATVNAGSTADLVVLRVPRGFYGFVNWLGQDTQNDVAGAGGGDWANLQWSVLVGPSTTQLTPVQGLDAFTFQYGQIEAPCRINVFVPEGWVCVLRVANTSVANIPNVAGRLSGWMWPWSVRMSSTHANAHIVG